MIIDLSSQGATQLDRPLESKSGGRTISASSSQVVRRMLRDLHASFYDAAEPALDPKHWGKALTLSANAALDPEIRRQLRDRARYEIANNSIAHGMVQTMVTEVIGTGPRLDIRTGSLKIDQEIQAAWCEWSDATMFDEKIRILYRTAPESGEGFATLYTNPQLAGLPVMLDIYLIEADRVSSDYHPEADREVDGVIYNEYGVPQQYRVLKYHPGDVSHRNMAPAASRLVDASRIIHWFRPTRPEQMRGIPYIAPALPLFGMLRRFTLASLRAAETAASFAGVLQTDASPDMVDEVDPFDTVELEHNLLTTLPMGWKLGQIDAKQPIQTYEMFKRELVKEISNCIEMPYNIAISDSSNHNYASGRLDRQKWHKYIQTDRSRLEARALRPVVREFLREYAMSGRPGSAKIRNKRYKIGFFWDTFGHVDPLKEEKARTERLLNGSTSPQEEAAKDGVDWLQRLDYQQEYNQELERRGMQPIQFGQMSKTADSAEAEAEVEEEAEETEE